MSTVEIVGTLLVDQKAVSIGVLMATVTYILHFIGLVAPTWTTSTETHVITISIFYGLWAECQLVEETGSILCESWSTGSLTDVFRAAQAVVMFAFLSLTCAVLGLTMSVFLNRKESIALVVSCNLLYVAGFLTFLGVFLFSQAKIKSSSLSWGCVLVSLGGVFSMLLGGYFTFVFFFKRYAKRREKEKRQDRIKNLRNARREQQKTRRDNKIVHGQTCPVVVHSYDLYKQQDKPHEKSLEYKHTAPNKHTSSDFNGSKQEEFDESPNIKISRNLPKLKEVSRGLPKNTPDIKPPKLPMIKTGTNAKIAKKNKSIRQNVTMKL